MILILLSQLFPGVLLVIPYFMMASAWGLYNTYAGLILAYVSFALPFCVWMLKGFFDSIPRELDEAALVDGCSRFRAFLRVVLPGAAPGIGATALFAFFLAWTEFLFALCLTSSQSMFPVTVGIASNIGQYRILWNELMASALLSSLPAIVVFFALERHLVAGLTSGAVKG
jgi:ABC-type glycerol-3-phosphate transport system permease component